MIAFTKQQKIDAYKLLLPQEKEVVYSETVGNTIAIVADKYQFNELDSKRLRFSIGLYLLGLIPESSLIQVFSERFPTQPADAIFKDVKDTVFPEIEKVKAAYVPEPEEESSAQDDNSTVSTKPSLDETMDRDELLKAIEDPHITQNTSATTHGPDKYREPLDNEPAAPQMATPKNTSIEDRLKGIVFTANESKNIAVDRPMPSAPTIPEEKLPPAPKVTLPRYTGPDPYREQM